MAQDTTAATGPTTTDPVAGVIRPPAEARNTDHPAAEPKPDSLSLFAVDANALKQAIWSGQGHDVSRLVSDLLKSRDAA
tara:strand:- start:13022 stop:13258 length:237 start_codon:yes stop_codon:yes gene_type:complete